MSLGELNQSNFDEALKELKKIAEAKKQLLILGIEPQVWVRTQGLTHEQVQLLYQLMKVN
ncbi:hypothetical protein [Vibrio vulnificus]|uniref:hypothetical protein n=1 Tax=Vibrio vulnificus TaxID=672 RepID=UPI00102C50A8|nr:hypothetical protein [Vibrio vulnificus]RZR42450.1 hypothetical protein D8T58_19240 [Vibrio vulnificus]